jgi:hypothetical protein
MEKRDTSNILALRHINTGRTIVWKGHLYGIHDCFLRSWFKKRSEKSINIYAVICQERTCTLDWSHVTVCVRYFKLTRTQHTLYTHAHVISTQDEFS